MARGISPATQQMAVDAQTARPQQGEQAQQASQEAQQAQQAEEAAAQNQENVQAEGEAQQGGGREAALGTMGLGVNISRQA